MDKLVIEGPTKLAGQINVSRAKNAYLPILAGVLLNPHPVHLKNLPDLRDINTIIKLLGNLGVKITKSGNITTFDASNITSYDALYDLVKTMRASILVLGPLLARFKSARVSLPGGCAIGTRPIDIHLENFKKLGALINLEGGYVEAHTDGLKGANLKLSFPSVGATENLMMGAVLAEGVTVIENVALEPEIDDLAYFLKKMGAKIEGIGTSTLTITGVKELKECEYEAIGDRIEGLTYIMAGLITGSNITVAGLNPKHIDQTLTLLKDMGAEFELGEDKVTIKSNKLKAIDVETSPFPGFPTDAQAQLMALTTQVEGKSKISEKIFENRFMHVPELQRLGARITLKGNEALVEGPSKLKGAPIMCTDLRASAALVLAALASHGKTEIHRVYHLDRGYEKLEDKLNALGANIQRVK
ncbi:MAG: UDP-N-acetylglucosamine 1-carboxyvinyltransferase [Epsilonproteobacteria bacterium]|nr:MAG: UDP-N-acetylglucosamine 1-carboxyvinyltransferase [Campylobacterota bacterium]RLA65954.1 MAG: UDP-N-acetylglucosamine 1-carboxyvinyltransferase [Campylobacterota bacterium]